jgi:hypothetical protein
MAANMLESLEMAAFMDKELIMLMIDLFQKASGLMASL